MNIYIGLFIYFCFVSCLDFFSNEKLRRFFFFISFVILVFFAGFRFDTGWDYNGYRDYYNNIPSLLEIPTYYDEFSAIYFEPGFKLFMSSLKALGIEFQGLLFITNFITTIFFFIFIRRADAVIGYKNVMVLLYFSTVFLYTNFSVLRQGIAISLWLFAIDYLNKSSFKYTLLVLLGCLFHYSVALFLILPILMTFRPKQSFLIFIMIASVVVYSLNIKWLQMISPLFPDFVYSKLSHYWESERFGSARSLGFGFIEKLLFISTIVFFYFYKLKNEYIKKEFYPYVIIYFLYFICYMLFFEATIVYDRTRLYFASFSICVFPFLLRFFSYYSKLIIQLSILAYSLFMFNNILSSDANKLVFIPYHSIFNDENSIPEYQKGRLRTDLGISIDHDN
ncbi:putative polysaccharide polymerase [Actinobacillus minor 202]|uniref:Polysaccharide polymerase n=1 Tax=Actinobacillus minor 202 TaxID=591023 RepID=A0ABP2DNC1_9PAST|nr:EpsG family protein [Actinobacillus minor]EEF16042.1 putative polysaccharide polymerase [Actinobacillus minor 202]